MRMRMELGMVDLLGDGNGEEAGAVVGEAPRGRVGGAAAFDGGDGVDEAGEGGLGEVGGGGARGVVGVRVVEPDDVESGVLGGALGAEVVAGADEVASLARVRVAVLDR